MKEQLITITLLAVLSLFVTNANAAWQCTTTNGDRTCTEVADDHSAGWDSLVERPGNIGPAVGVGMPQSPLGSSISAPSGPPSAQHLKLVAEAQARAKESASQWWTNFFNNIGE